MSDQRAVLEVTVETRDSAIPGFQDSTGNSISDISNPSANQRSPSLDSFSAFQDLNSSLDLVFEPGSDFAVKVDDPQKHAETLETYVTYRIRSKSRHQQTENVARRRYNHFKALRGRLCALHPWQVVPPLPGSHPLLAQLDRYDKQFVLKRCSMLNTFLKRLSTHIILSQSEDLKLFLTLDNDRLQSHFKPKAGLFERMSSSIQGFTGPEAAAAPPPRVRDPEFVALQDYLTALHDKLHQLRKLTAKLGKESWDLSHTTASVTPSLSAWSSRSGHNAIPSHAVGRACASLAVCQSRAATSAAALDAPLIDAMLYIDAFKERLSARDALHGFPVPFRHSLPFFEHVPRISTVYPKLHLVRLLVQSVMPDFRCQVCVGAYVLACQGGPQKSQLAGDLHDRLEYASASLRDEANRWLRTVPQLTNNTTDSNAAESATLEGEHQNKTHTRPCYSVGSRGDARRVLLALANSQLNLHSEALSIWQHALRDANHQQHTNELTPTNDSILDPNKMLLFPKPLNNGVRNPSEICFDTTRSVAMATSNDTAGSDESYAAASSASSGNADDINKKMAATLLNNL